MSPLVTLRLFKLARAVLIFAGVYGISSALLNLDFARALGMTVFSLYGLMTLGASLYWSLQLVEIHRFERSHLPGLLGRLTLSCAAAVLVANTLGTVQGLLLLPCGAVLAMTRIRKQPHA